MLPNVFLWIFQNHRWHPLKCHHTVRQRIIQQEWWQLFDSYWTEYLSCFLILQWYFSDRYEVKKRLPYAFFKSTRSIISLLRLKPHSINHTRSTQMLKRVTLVILYCEPSEYIVLFYFSGVHVVFSNPCCHFISHKSGFCESTASTIIV